MGSEGPPPCGTAPIERDHFVAATLAAARAHALDHGVDLDTAGRTPRPPHESAPAVGAVHDQRFVVAGEHTAAAVGHPDERVAVLSSPTIALWFELVASALMPRPGGPLRHVGVGIVVHHLGGAAVGDEVSLEASVRSVDGRAVRFACDAWCGDELVATGDHQRVIVEEG